MISIENITAEEILDSRGRPTIAVTVQTRDSGGTAEGTFAVPSGASTGAGEANELRDEDGHMSAALSNIRDIIFPALRGMDVCGQSAIDKKMLGLDGTPNKSRLGGNALIGVSIACAKAAAVAQSLPTYQYLKGLRGIRPSRTTPYLYLNYINGGKHAKSPLSFQEHMIVPETDSIGAAIECAKTVSSALATHIENRFGPEGAASMGDEGGFVLQDPSPRIPFELLRDAIKDSGAPIPMHIAIDAAATSFFKNGTYDVGDKPHSPDELLALYSDLSKEFSLLSIEDPFEENAFDDFARLQATGSATIIGDDLTTTNASRIQQAVAKKSIRAVIIKPNQIGTLSETLDAMQLARQNDIDCIVSHRSGETNDDFIADLAYAFGVFGLKAGALRKPERAVKYERLAHISKKRL
ncbi:MAG: Enolase [Candidatus Kaiserbacteria bacterium GW2011_GWB1_52_6]|uniref:Enolase n=1 Tax=Candidatus Kaiserbacteria bacterium GW2011_GWB1_52_6 TaxID=1618674 RepID=A0A0G1ZEM9_9BACT|nr:MAG: Enolase [Candidatus Kaiserbacteria bacterium GW2011_GWB1_52_6]